VFDSLPEREPVRRWDIDRQFFVRMIMNLLNLPNLRDQQPDVHGDSPNVGLLSSRKNRSSEFERAGAWRRAYPLPLMTGIAYEDAVVSGIALLFSLISLPLISRRCPATKDFYINSSMR